MSKDAWLNVEKLFYEISKDWFGEREISYESERRSGVFSAALTIWLMILQRLSGMPMQGAVVGTLNREGQGIFAKLNTKSKKLAHGTVSSNSGGFSRARDRLDLSYVNDLVEHCWAKLRGKGKAENFYILDGTCLTTAHSNENAARYPRHSVGKDKSIHFPRLRVVTAHALANGIALKPIHGTMTDSEQALTWKFLPVLPKHSTVM